MPEHSALSPPSSSSQHYLQAELYTLLSTDSAYFEFIEQGSLDGIWYWDMENPSEEWMSGRFWQTFGYDASKMPHKASSWQHMIFQEDLELALENLKAHCEDPSHPYDQVVRYCHQDGSTVWVRCRGIAVRDNNGRPVRMLGAHSDITPLKRIEQQLQNKNNELSQANAQLAKFAYAASHDIQSPIRTLNGLLDILNEDHLEQLDDQGRKVLDMALRSAKRIQTLIKGILDYSHSGRHAPDAERIDCNTLIQHIVIDLEEQIGHSQTNIRYSTLPTIHAPLTPVRQLFQNLISNAMKFTPQGTPPQIRIDSEVNEDDITFTVTDQGIGIDPQFHDSIFEVFEQIHTRSDYEGAGLGLSLCQQIVSMLNGRIRVESALGQGATFYITLPIELLTK